MSDKRKADFTFLLKKSGNESKKVELFNSNQWSTKASTGANKYRLRVNGHWFPKGEKMRFFDKWEIRDLMWRSINI